MLLIIGVLMVTQSNDVLGVGAGQWLTALVVGLALLLLYWIKRKTLALIAGAYMTLFGAANIVNSLGIGKTIGFDKIFPAIISGSVFFLIPGIIFLLLYFQKNKRALLLPGFLFLWMYVYFILLRVPFFARNSVAFFLMCVGLGGVCACFIGRGFIGARPRYVSICVTAAGLAGLLNLKPPELPFGSPSKIVPFILMGVGVLVIIAARKK
jgi:hypothetical protein